MKDSANSILIGKKDQGLIKLVKGRPAHRWPLGSVTLEENTLQVSIVSVTFMLKAESDAISVHELRGSGLASSRSG
jgi:hypothetical protein